MAGFYHWDGEQLILHLYVQPGATKDEIVGPYGDSLKVRITAPPVDNKANQHLVKFLAKIFGVTKSQLHLLSGNTNRHKKISVSSPCQLPDMISQPINAS